MFYYIIKFNTYGNALCISMFSLLITRPSRFITACSVAYFMYFVLVLCWFWITFSLFHTQQLPLYPTILQFHTHEEKNKQKSPRKVLWLWNSIFFQKIIENYCKFSAIKRDLWVNNVLKRMVPFCIKTKLKKQKCKMIVFICLFFAINHVCKSSLSFQCDYYLHNGNKPHNDKAWQRYLSFYASLKAFLW